MSIWEEYYLSKYFNIFGKQPQEIQKKLYNDYITALNQYYTLVRPDLKGKIKSNITMKDLQKLGVEEVILAYDRENDTNPESEQTREYEQKLLKVVLPLTKYMNVYIVMDYEGLLPPKGSPSDMGQETLEKLMKKKIYIPSPEVDFKKERKRAAKK